MVIHAHSAMHAAVQGVPLTEYAEDHKELKQALEKWGSSLTP